MKRAIALLITCLILALLFWNVDQPRLWANLRHTHQGWFAAAIFAFIPQIGLIAWRWKRLVSAFTPLRLTESIKMILASQTMNLVLPSKMGDLSKGYFLSRAGHLDLPRAMNVVVFEKMLDVATLAGFMLLGLAALLLHPDPSIFDARKAIAAGIIGAFAVSAVLFLYFIPMRFLPGFSAALQMLERRPRLRKLHTLAATSHDVITLLQTRGARRGEILGLSILIWILHLSQIYCFFRALHAAPTVGQFAMLVPLAIFIGLLPISIAGFGTRDAAFVLLFRQFAPDVMLGVAMFINLRYLLPTAAGVPFLHTLLRARNEAALPAQLEEN